MSEEVLPRYPWQIHRKWKIPQTNDWKSSRRKCLSTNGCSCDRKSYPPFDTTRILLLQKWLVASFEHDKFRCCANAAQTWLQKAVSTLQQLKEKEESAQRNEQWHRILHLLIHGEIGKVLGELLMNQILIEQGDLLNKYLEQLFGPWFSRIHLFCYRWIVYN